MAERVWTVGGFADGLVGTLAYRVISASGDTLVARTTVGVEANGESNYKVAVEWTDSWTGYILWDDGTDAAIDTFVGTISSPDAFDCVFAVNMGAAYSGLSTVGYTIVGADDVDIIARTTTGVTEVFTASGIYIVVVSRDPSLNGRIDWDIATVVQPGASDPIVAFALDAGYDSIYRWIRSRLLDSVTSLADSYFDMDIESQIRRILSPYSLVYADITDATDLANFNEAVGLMVAARLQVPLTTGGGTSALASESVAGVGGESLSRTFQSAATGDQCDLWLMQAKQALAQISFVKTRSGSNNSRFARDGRRRQIDAQETCCDWRDC